MHVKIKYVLKKDLLHLIHKMNQIIIVFKYIKLEQLVKIKIIYQIQIMIKNVFKIKKVLISVINYYQNENEIILKQMRNNYNINI